MREFQVRLDPEKLAARRLSASDVVDAIRKNNVLNSAGLIESNHELYLSLVTGKPAFVLGMRYGGSGGVGIGMTSIRSSLPRRSLVFWALPGASHEPPPSPVVR